MRDEFSPKTKDILFKRAGAKCSNPNCRKSTSGPHTDPEKTINIGVAAHITAAEDGGPRYDSSLSSDERKHIENGIWLCQDCAKLIDNDEKKYTVDIIKQWKRLSEEAALLDLEKLNNNKHTNEDNCFNNEIKIVIDGRLRVFVCKVDDIKFGVKHTPYISVATGELICTLKNNAYSSSIKLNQRFILSEAVWCVIGVDKTKIGITSLTCKRELKGPYDDFNSGIASKNLISNFVIELLAPIKDIALNQEITLNPMLYKDNKLLENANLVMESLNESIVSIKNNSFVALSIGKATIKITWKDDKDIFQIFNVNVKEKVEDIVTYRLYKINLATKKKSYKEFDCHQNSTVIFGIDKFINGKLVNNDEAFDFSIKTNKGKEQLEIKEKSDRNIKIYTEKLNSYTLKVINRETGEELSVAFDIKGLF